MICPQNHLALNLLEGILHALLYPFFNKRSTVFSRLCLILPKISQYLLIVR